MKNKANSADYREETYGNFTLTLERDEETIFSTVSHPDGYSASLGCLEGLGYLEDDKTGTRRKPVPQKVIEYFWSLEESFIG